MLPTRELIHPVDLTLPHLPAPMVGLRIAHISDLHVTRPRLRRRHREVVSALRSCRLDMVIFTGDYITHAGQEQGGLEVMRYITGSLRPRVGMFGVFGNHDTPELRQLFTELPVTWLHNSVHLEAGLGMEILGLGQDRSGDTDVLALLDGVTPPPPKVRWLRVMLCHRPASLPTAADLGVDLLFSGHTHGGQMRLPWFGPLRNSSDYPLRLTSGLLRHRDTICVVSRGLGEVNLPLRLFCDPHLPVYTLRPGPLPGRFTDHVENVKPW